MAYLSDTNLVAATTISCLALPSFALAFIAPSQKAQRASIIVLCASFLLPLQFSPDKISNNLFLNGIILVTLWAPLLRGLDLLLMRNIHMTTELNATTQIAGSNLAFESKLSRFLAAFILMQSSRRVGTPWAVKGIPPFSKNDPKHVPSRTRFLVNGTLTCVLTYLAIDATNLLPMPDIDTQIPERKQAVFSRLSEVDAEELITRAAGVLILCVVTLCYVASQYYTFAVIAVGSGLSEPASWPPIVGSVAECWSLRNFWGSSWHQQLRGIVEPIANGISGSVFRLRKGTVLSRYTRLALAFSVSAIWHVSIDYAQGTQPLDSGAPKFFFMQAAGILAEDTVQKIYQRFGGKPSTWSRIIGYVWVWLFLIWTTPSWTWISARALLEKDDKKLPYSFVEHFGLTTPAPGK